MLVKLPNIKILAIDPGETSGVIQYYCEKILIDKQMKQDELFNFLSDYGFSSYIWVVESFRLYKHKAITQINNDMITPQIIGVIKDKAKEIGCSIIFQSASQVKGLCTDDLLKEYSFWVGGKHCRDAARHALYYLLTHREEK